MAKGFAQQATIKVGIDGLTCSLCSYSVERSIKQLPYITNFEMDLNANIATFEIPFDEKISPTAIAKKIVDAGYSVRNFFVVVDSNFKTISLTKIFPNAALLNADETADKLTNNYQWIDKKHGKKGDYKKWAKQYKDKLEGKNQVNKEWFVAL